MRHVRLFAMSAGGSKSLGSGGIVVELADDRAGSARRSILKSVRATSVSAKLVESLSSPALSPGLGLAQAGMLDAAQEAVLKASSREITAARTALEAAIRGSEGERFGVSGLLGEGAAGAGLGSIADAFPASGIAAPVASHSAALLGGMTARMLAAVAQMETDTQERMRGIGGVSMLNQRVQDDLAGGALTIAARRALETTGLGSIGTATGIASASGSAFARIGSSRELPFMGLAATVEDIVERAGLSSVEQAMRLAGGLQGTRTLAKVGLPGADAGAFTSLSSHLHEVAARTDLFQASWAGAAGFASPVQEALAASLLRPADAIAHAGMAGVVERAMKAAGLSLPRVDAMGAALLGGDALAASLRALTDATRIAPFPEISQETRQRWERGEKLAARMEGSALWYVIEPLSISHLSVLAELEDEAMEETILDALELVVTEEGFIDELASALDNVGHISDQQRVNLRHGLEHAAQRDYLRASAPLMVGMEGAIWATAKLKLVDAKQRFVIGPKRGKRARSIEQVIKLIPAAEGFSTFAIRRVFGGGGNAFRHGEGTTNRRQVLYVIVLLAGWLTDTAGVPAREVLGQYLRDALLR